MNELLSELLDNALHLCNIYQSATEQYDKTAFIQNFKSAEHLKTNSNRGENHAQVAKHMFLNSVEMTGTKYNNVSEQFERHSKASFFSQLKLDEYHQLEERYTQELTLLTKKLFFEVSVKYYLTSRSNIMIIDTLDNQHLIMIINLCDNQQL